MSKHSPSAEEEGESGSFGEWKLVLHMRAWYDRSEGGLVVAVCIKQSSLFSKKNHEHLQQEALSALTRSKQPVLSRGDGRICEDREERNPESTVVFVY